MQPCARQRDAAFRILWILLLIFSTDVSGRSQEMSDDPWAVSIIDRMTDVIGDIESCKFKLVTATDIPDPAGGVIKEFANFEIFLSGNNKMLINAQGYKGNRQYKYNGSELAVYSIDENNYGVIRAPATTLQTIDSLSAHYGIDFPAADFFYPALTDDIIEHSDVIRYLGMKDINGRSCYHIFASGKEIDVQLWIRNDGINLPEQFVITYKTLSGAPQYHGWFSDWELNQRLPSTMFEFVPPPGSAKVRILSQSES